MSHSKDWTCPNCKAILGQLRAHALFVLAPRPAVGGGVVAVACPSCGLVARWRIAEPVRAGR